MDKILFIDGMNFIYRGKIIFGQPKEHKLCNLSPEEHSFLEHAAEPHCDCGSPFNLQEQFCYGERYSLIYNFFRNLRPIIELFSPDKCFFVLEGHPQFRYDLYPDYKANRIIKQGSVKQQDKDKIFEATEAITELLQYLPLTVVKADQYEADDTIGTLAENMKEEDLTIVSGDTDYIQMLQRDYPNIKLYNATKKMYLEAPPYPYVAFKSLTGDKSDNIKSLMSKNKSLKTINDPNLFKKFLSLEENRANFNINKTLIDFHPVPEEELILKEGNRNFMELQNRFNEMKFVSITNEKSWKKYCLTFDCLKY